MARALLGHVGVSPDWKAQAEVEQLKRTNDLLVSFLGSTGLTYEQIAVIVDSGDMDLRQRITAIARMGGMPTDDLVIVSIPEGGITPEQLPDDILGHNQTVLAS